MQIVFVVATDNRNWQKILVVECCERDAGLGGSECMDGTAFTQFDRQCTLCSSERMVVVLVAGWTMMVVGKLRWGC